MATELWYVLCSADSFSGDSTWDSICICFFLFFSIRARHVLIEPLLIVVFSLNSPVYAVSVCCFFARSAL